MSTRNPQPSPAVFPVLTTSAEAQALADAKSRGFTQGHSAGYAAGMQLAGRAAEAERTRLDAEQAATAAAWDARMEAELKGLQLAAAALKNRTTPVLDDAEQALFRCALELAQALLGHELRDGETSAKAALSRARGLGGDEVPVGIRMNPADVATLGTAGHALPDGVSLLADPAISRGDAVADYPQGFLDARLETAVRRVAEVLFGDSLRADTAADAA